MERHKYQFFIIVLYNLCSGKRDGIMLKKGE